MENIIKYIIRDDIIHREKNTSVPWNVGLDFNGGFCSMSNENSGWQKHLFNIE